jgi:lysophospholipase L1-like esterase
MVLYPDQKELAAVSPLYADFKKAMTGAMGDCCQFLELRAQPTWKASLYRDEIHPSAEGNTVLAAILRKSMGQ